MNYVEQQQYFRRSQLLGGVWAATIFLWALAAVLEGGFSTVRLWAPFLLVITAVAVSIFYSPDYLHLTVNRDKRSSWELKIRWRIVAAVFLLGVIFSPGLQSIRAATAAAAWLAGANLIAKPVVPRRFFAAYYWATDLAIIAALLTFSGLNALLAAALMAASAQLSILICEKRPVIWAVVVSAAGSLLLAFREHIVRTGRAHVMGVVLLWLTALCTAFLVRRAQQYNHKNIQTAMAELMSFTGYSEEKVRHFWSVSNQELAANWERAAIPHDDRERLAQWYRDNSELYLFAISGYNLEYRRIQSNLKVLKLARGATLDYGAGNGEILLEVARRGQPATYYDVDGVTMRFARHRAQQRGLELQFFHEKQGLAQAASKTGFDTIFSFDVLEHLPDLPGELRFLSSLLNPGGLVVFDVPSGSTKAHPMHLDHNLDVRQHMLSLGMRDKSELLPSSVLRKDEKYAFMRPA